MKTLNLTIGERVAATKIINDFKGSIDKLAYLLDDIKEIAIKTEEWEGVDLVKTPGKDADGNAVESWQWNDEKGMKDVTFTSEGASYLEQAIKDKSDKNELTIADKSLLTLKKKLA